MNDPHVEQLSYAVSVNEGFDFARAPDLALDTEHFKGLLSHDSLLLMPKQHFAREADAKSVADQFVKDWEISAGVAQGSPVFKFRFSGSVVVDRSPLPQHQSLEFAEPMGYEESWTMVVSPAEYPRPPITQPSRSADDSILVGALWDRFSAYRAKREPLLSMAYASKTLIDHFGGGPHKAPSFYRIDPETLRHIARLSSIHGDFLTARKYKAEAEPLPLSDQDATWLVDAIIAIIRHLNGPRDRELSIEIPPSNTE